MNTQLLKSLIDWPTSFISGTGLKAILPGSENTRKAIIKRAVKEGYLQGLKRDHYLILNIPNKPLVNNFELAQFIYGPSYISFESALSYHGWIPEGVATTCSATIKRSKTFNTPIGEFSFEKIPNQAFRFGVAYVAEEKTRYLVAEPWKAIADMIYCRKKYWQTLTGMMQDLRIEDYSIKNHQLDLLTLLSNEYPHKATQKTLRLLLKELQQ